MPFGFWRVLVSDPLGLVPGKPRAIPQGVGQGNTPIVEAAAMQDATDHAVLLSGHSPADGAGPVQAALPATVAALLHGCRRRAALQGPGWALSHSPGHRRVRAAPGVRDCRCLLELELTAGLRVETTLGGFTTYGPLLVDATAFPAPLAVGSGTGSAQPDMGRSATPISAPCDLSSLRSYVANTPSSNTYE